MHRSQNFEDGDIVLSTLYHRIGVIEGWPRCGQDMAGNVLKIHFTSGKRAEIPICLIRHATRDEEAEFKRRLNNR